MPEREPEPERTPHLLLGVTGSIAAFKSPLLVREFVKRGIEVRVAMTRSAAAFVTPLTLATVSRYPVATETLPNGTDTLNAGTWHIDLALWADVMLIAPASAYTIAKLLHGEADTPVAMLALAMRSPLIVAPAMDEEMFVNPATQANIAVLQERGIHVIPPARGELASGITGEGRLAEIDTIVAEVSSLLAKRTSMRGVRVLVTAGQPTNRSTPSVSSATAHPAKWGSP